MGQICDSAMDNRFNYQPDNDAINGILCLEKDTTPESLPRSSITDESRGEANFYLSEENGNKPLLDLTQLIERRKSKESMREDDEFLLIRTDSRQG